MGNQQYVIGSSKFELVPRSGVNPKFKRPYLYKLDKDSGPIYGTDPDKFLIFESHKKALGMVREIVKRRGQNGDGVCIDEFNPDQKQWEDHQL